MNFKVLPEIKMYPPVPDSDRVWYLLLHLGFPSKHILSSSRHIIQAKQSCKEIGLKLSVFPIGAGGQPAYSDRYFFRFPYYRRDDETATHLGEIILLTAWVTCGPLGDPEDFAPVLRIPRELIDKQLPLLLDDLVKLEYSRDWSDRVLYFPKETIGSFSGFAEYRIEKIWRRFPIIVSNDHLLRAVRFLKTSKENFHVYPGQITNVLDHPNKTAQFLSEQTHLETALHSAFMSLEAIIGDPPKNDRKLGLRLREVGLDPSEGVGYSTKKTLLQTIREFSDARDKKSAHGSISSRTISVLETLEFQSCAEYVLDSAIEKAILEG